MSNFLKANIRLQKISERNKKPHYSHLTPDKKRLVKAMEIRTQCENEMTREECVLGNKNWRQESWAGELLEKYWKAGEQISRYMNKLGLETEQEANEIYKSTRTSRYYGGSF